MELLDKENFPIKQEAGLFLKIESKILPYKNNLSFCSKEKLSGKPVTPLYLKSSMVKVANGLYLYYRGYLSRVLLFVLLTFVALLQVLI